MRESLCALVALAAVTTPALAQLQFAPAPTVPVAGELVFDSRRQVVVVLEASPGPTGRMWQWDGATFRERLGPMHDYGQLATFDLLRNQIHTIAGFAKNSWDGATWHTTPLPANWQVDGMAFDEVRSRLVATLQGRTEIAEWDGTNWSLITPAMSPGATPAGTGTPPVFDPSRGRCVMVAGTPPAVFSWDGAQWLLVDAQVPALGGHLVVDRSTNQLVLHGSHFGAVETWRRDPAGWQQLTTPASFSDLSPVSLAWDGIGILRIGARVALSEGVWRLQNQTWHELPVAHPRPRHEVAIASAPSHPDIVVFGGALDSYASLALDETWTFATVGPLAGTWQRHDVAVTPPARRGGAMAWSNSDQAFVLFGGRDAQQQPLADTWTWNGTVWLQRLPLNSPPAGWDYAMASDPSGGVSVLAGGTQAFVNTDHWRWLGGTWTNLGPEPLPFGFDPTLVAHDPVRNRLVATRRLQAREWDGTAWTALPDLPVFALSSGGESMGFRPDTQTVLYYDALGPQAAEWNGVSWSQVNAAPASGAALMLAADFAHARLRSFNHHATGAPPNQWNGCDAVFTATGAVASQLGVGCAVGPPPGLVANSRPRPGDGAFAFEGATLLANAPCLLGLGLPTPPQPLGTCTLYVSQPLAVHFLVADGAGQARVPLPLPANGALRGVTLTAQFAVVNGPGAGFGGLTFSAGLSVTIGD